MPIYDISRPLGPSTVVWPGDVEVTLERTTNLAAGDLVNTSALRTTVHAASHLDAPRHLSDAGIGVDEVDLSRCLGPARVLEVGAAATIGPDLVPALSGVSRVLFKTAGSAGAPAAWPPSFIALEPETAASLADAGVVLVGVDTPSVDPADSEDLPAHRALLGRGVVVLENLWLGEVAAGDYELIALPLRLVGADGSPVRAVLRSLEPK